MGVAPVVRVLVAGGGIAGLAAAHALVRSGADVVLVESGPSLGGKIATERVDGFTIERGPDSFLTLRTAALDLARELGLGAEVMAPKKPEDVFIWHRDRLLPIPAGTGLGIPTRFVPFLLSPLFSPLEKLRAAAEVAMPAAPPSGDVAIGAVLRRRFGDPVVDRLAGPLVSAIYGLAVDELSLDALMPRLRDALARHGSLVRAGLAARATRSAAPAGPQVVTLRRGMGSLVDALASRLAPAEVRLGTPLESVERSGARYVARLGDGTVVDADGVVIATPAAAAARALGNVAPGAAEALRTIAYRGTAGVSLAYEERRLRRPLTGHGFLVPEGALPIVACTWTSSKWSDRAPDGTVLMRATIRADGLLRRGPDELVDVAHRSLARAMGIEGAPLLARTAVWDGAMPRYSVGHLERLACIAAALAPLPGIALAGAAYRGTGVPDCIAQGQAAAQEILSRETKDERAASEIRLRRSSERTDQARGEAASLSRS
ncbi:MAG: protoporphyrinogen oxidase [Chloroflexota bacterium]|nr:protoporphyrinogen oxidase [Chloroflexota bacterium]